MKTTFTRKKVNTKKKIKKFIQVNSLNKVKIAKTMEQRPNPEAEELRISQRNLDIVKLTNF
ncbi:MAG: hypothetical protein WBA93_17195 [Microcoleaceae cyanobacterium]